MRSLIAALYHNHDRESLIMCSITTALRHMPCCADHAVTIINLGLMLL